MRLKRIRDGLASIIEVTMLIGLAAIPLLTVLMIWTPDDTVWDLYAKLLTTDFILLIVLLITRNVLRAH